MLFKNGPAGLLVLSLVLAGCGLAGEPGAGPPLPSTAPVTVSTRAVSGSPPATAPVAGRSVPQRLEIPRIKVSSPVGSVGLNADGTIQVPPFVDHSPAAWYRHSPTPGQVGPAVLVGHSTMGGYGPSVFYRLGELRPGDRIDVRRADGSVARFSVERVGSYPKTAFPTSAVYGNVDHAALRLITCGGDRPAGQSHYPDNVIVFARLVALLPA